MENSGGITGKTPSAGAAADDDEHRHRRAPANSFLLRRGYSIPELEIRRVNGGGDLELRPWRSSDYSFPAASYSYTSLHDLIPSPPASSAVAGTPRAAGDIQIKNRLLQQAAYAYLTPTPSATESTLRPRKSLLRRVLAVVTCGLTDTCLELLCLF